MSDPFYRTDEWRRLRAEVLKRDPWCRTPGCGRPSRDVDHIVQRARGGADHPSNLRGLCTSCHSMRRQGGEPYAKGCDAAGNPRDPGHWWSGEKSLRAGGQDRWGVTRKVSFFRGRR